MKKLIDIIITLLERQLDGMRVFLLFLLCNLVYTLMLSVTIPQTMEFSQGLKLLDMMPAGFDLKYVNALFSALGDKGRWTYLTTQIPVDLIYPGLFALSYSLVIAYFMKKLSLLKTSARYFTLLPIVAGLADYLENFGIITMLTNYPVISPTAVKVTSTFSVIKSTSTTFFFVSLLVLLVMLGFKTIKKLEKFHRQEK